MILKYFKSSILVTLFSLILSFGVGFFYAQNFAGAAKLTFLTLVLAVLEISLSFDNAVVNASLLKKMTPLWRHRFLTWGMWIAVFGMRLVFPLVIVSVLAQINPWQALVLASTRPDEYAHLMEQSHSALSGFGGGFLLMVALKYFFDHQKDVHWVKVIESPLAKLGKVEAIEMALTLGIVFLISRHLPIAEAYTYLASGVLGLVTFVLVDGISSFLEDPEQAAGTSAKASFGLFMYLEVLDASFSFDGVIGAFALTHNIFIMAIGLGVGAMFVRSLTILLVEEGTLSHYRYLEHGAFYAIGALAMIMLCESLFEVPDFVTGFLGAGIIGISIYNSVTYNRRQSKR